jgi:hypothetical protein
MRERNEGADVVAPLPEGYCGGALDLRRSRRGKGDPSPTPASGVAREPRRSVVGVRVSEKTERRNMALFDRASVGRGMTRGRRTMRLGWLVVAGAAFAVPVAHADNWGVPPPEHATVSVRPDDRTAGPRADALTAIAAPVRVDDRGGTRGVGSTSAARSTSATALSRPDDRVGVRGFGPAPSPAAAAVVVSRVDSFQWADAGIGAASAVAAMMLLAGIALVTRRYRASPRPVAP